MDKHKLILPVSILLGCTILGGFLYVSEINKQKSIEKQQEIKMQEDRKVEEAKAGQIKQERVDKYLQDQEAKIEVERQKRVGATLLDVCLNEAHNKLKKSAQFWFNVESQISDEALIKRIDEEEVVEQQDRDECFKRYPQ